MEKERMYEEGDLQNGELREQRLRTIYNHS